MAEPRIIEFEGPSSLLEASNELLYGPPDIQAAIIHRAGSAAMYAACRTAPSASKAREVLCDGLPQLRGVTDSLRDWIRDRLPDYCRLGDFGAFRGGGNIDLHIDNTPIDYRPDLDTVTPPRVLEGPLTFSYRAGDQPLLPGKPSPLVRKFYVKRTTASHLTTDGFEYDLDSQLYMDLKQRSSMDEPTQGIIHADQEPDDLVFFLNYPTPTLHAVDEIEKATGLPFFRSTSKDPDFPTRLHSLIGYWDILVDLPPMCGTTTEK